MNENNLIENMIRWAEDRLGETRYQCTPLNILNIETEEG